MNALENRSVVVTGGTRGIGKAIALRLMSEGAKRVVLGYMRNDKAAESAAEEIRAAGAEPVLVRGNIASEKVIAEIASQGPYAAVVHNAATGVIEPALETEDRHWDWTLNANARALLSLARACAPDMASGSSIVAISSLGAQRVLENYVLVGTSKAALESVVRYLAVEHSITFRIAKRCFEQGRRERLRDGWSSPRTSPTRSRSSARPTRRWCAGTR